ncbi:lysophospholipid acyltransferase family protein [Parapedobacter sp. 10938]|uniref:lysophospholipid acyltransferase family protein n=1 Tax=Parapedobacter flavus TaxID=3110225 RepID=UPI002DB76A6C|nr:lysophospholipid acyltransferase family protein [Parapedobacter sp. 10938]MEC3879766.1 lysophospholipid acyltransferase family protein [Parapedobacter sp. 10938]
MMDNLKQTLRLFVYRFVYVAIYLISLLPMTFLYAMASFTFFVVYYLVGYRKEVVVQNVARSFPEKQYGEIHAIVKKFYECFVAYFAEMIKGVSIPTKTLDKKIVFENLELVDLYIKSGRNVIASVGHCGNWEALNFLPHKVQYDVHAVYKPLSSKLANSLMVKLRSRFGMKLIRDKAVIRYILSKNSSPAVYLFIADQRPKIKDEKYRFTLLNQETNFFSGMEKLARTSEAAVIYLHITQLTKGNYKVSCIPINAKAESTKVGEITQKYVELLTENIKEEPYGWLWTHKRWKR